MDYLLVLCPECDDQQMEEVHDQKEKFGWHCDNCYAKLEYWPDEEVSKRHLLANDPGTRFTTTKGGNVCTGFGGLPGELPRKY